MATEFVTVRGSRFRLGDRDFPVAGSNCYYLGYCPPEIPQMAESVLDTARDMSLNVMRIWAFLEPGAPPGPRDSMPWGGYFQLHDGEKIRPNESPDGLPRLDRAVGLAAERGIKLILVLSNSLPDFGGMDQYNRWLSPGETALFHDDFYQREDLCQAFEAWMRYLVLRTNPLTGRLYRDEPAILAWELANEPRCQSHKGLPARGDCVSSKRILNWVRRMSKALRSVDPNH
ncbi:MAG TPA: cellulase family glycosylhydrolase, partial [Gemmatimonadales bacterium]|nr:cellulase family glycosylhydrolase [Gemmatimonadales bacterium]